MQVGINYVNFKKAHNNVTDFLKTVEKVSKMCMGQDGLIFMEVAAKLKAATLFPKE